MSKTKFSPEVREHAVRMVLDGAGPAPPPCPPPTRVPGNAAPPRRKPTLMPSGITARRTGGMMAAVSGLAGHTAGLLKQAGEVAGGSGPGLDLFAGSVASSALGFLGSRGASRQADQDQCPWGGSFSEELMDLRTKTA